MTMIQTIFNWITAFSGFGGKQFRLDKLEAHSQAASVLCKGEEILSQSRDILGNLKQRKRLTLLVRVRGIDAQTLLDFARWAEDTAPVLGENQTLSIQQGSLYTSNPGAPGVYQCRVTLEYTNSNEVN